MKKIDEAEAIKEAKTFLESELGVKITVESEERSTNEKAQRALPLKPSIVLE